MWVTGLYGEIQQLPILPCSLNLSLIEPSITEKFSEDRTFAMIDQSRIIETINAYSMTCIK